MDSEIRDKAVTDKPDIPFVTFERVEAAYERNIKRLWIIILILLAMLTVAVIGSIWTLKAVNDKWAAVIAEYDMESYEVDMSSDGDSNATYSYIGEDGDIYNGGTNKSKEADTYKEDGK